MKALLTLAIVVALAGVAFADDTIYDVQNGTIPEGTRVTIEGVIVTAAPGEFSGAYCFVEEPGAGPYSGIEVYFSSAQEEDYAYLQRGDMVNVTGVVKEYYDMTEIDISAPGDTMVLVSSGCEIPGPDPVTTAGMMSEEWEGVLVQTGCAEVTDPNLGYGEWEIDDGSGPGRVDDKGQITYTPVLGDCNIYTGILAYTYGNYKLWPRDDNDIVGCGPSANEPTQWGSIKALYR